MARKVEPTAGDLVAVPVSDNSAYLTHIWAVALKNLILVATYDRIWGAENVVDGEPILLGLVTMDAVRRGRWPVVGWAPSPPSGSFPVYRMLYGGISHVVTIQADDGPRRRITTAEFDRLPDYTYDTPESLEWVLRSRLGLQDWGPLGDTGDFLPRRDSTEDTWFKNGR